MSQRYGTFVARFRPPRPRDGADDDVVGNGMEAMSETEGHNTTRSWRDGTPLTKRYAITLSNHCVSIKSSGTVARTHPPTDTQSHLHTRRQTDGLNRT